METMIFSGSHIQEYKLESNQGWWGNERSQRCSPLGRWIQSKSVWSDQGFVAETTFA